MKADEIKIDREQPITAIIHRRIASGCEKEFEAWAKEIAGVCQKYDGFLGIRVIRPQIQSEEHVTIISFDTYENYQAWHDSAERKTWIAKAEKFTLGSESTEHLTGFDYWLGKQDTARRSWPPDFKMVFAAYIAIWPLVYFVPPFLNPILPSEPLWGSLISTAVLTLLMGYLTLPAVTRIFRRWLSESLE